MLRFASLFLALFFATSAWAQTVSPSAVTPEQRRQFRADRKTCTEQIKPKDLPRGERGKAMRGCMEGRNSAYKAVYERTDQRREEMKQIRKDCRATTAAGKTLSRDERRTAMQACIVAKRPELAKPYACADQARQKGLKAGTERRQFMRECRKS